MATVDSSVRLVGRPCLDCLPDELLLLIFWYLDVPELLSISRTSRNLRSLALDPLLHLRRLRSSVTTLSHLLPHRPSLRSLQPPASAIYLSRTHVAARHLHWSLVRIRLNRSLSRRPTLANLVSANILPKECCRRDRASGQLMVANAGGGLIVERKRRVEREQVKAGLRVWLERKAVEIKKRKKDYCVGVGVDVLVWRFSKRIRLGDAGRDGSCIYADAGVASAKAWERPEDGKVNVLKRFWEGLGHAGHTSMTPTVAHGD